MPQKDVRQSRQLELLQQMAETLSRVLTVAEVASTIVELGTKYIGAPRGGVWQLSADGSVLELIHHQGYSAALVQAVGRIPVDSPLPLANVLRTNEICWLSSREDYARLYSQANAETHEVRTSNETAFFCAPLRVEGRPVGAFSLNYDHRREFDPEERRLIAALVDQAALALHRATLLASEREAKAAIERERRRFRAVFDHALDGLLLVDDDLRLVDANPAACRLLSRPQEDLVGRVVPTLAPSALEGGDPLEELRGAGVVANTERALLLPDGTRRRAELGAAANVLPGLHLISFRDIEPRKRVEESLRFLAEAGRILASSIDYDVTLAAITRLAVPQVADWAAVDLLEPETGVIRRVAMAHVDPKKVELGQELHQRQRVTLDSPHGVGRVIRTGTPSLTESVDDAMLARALADDPRSLALTRELTLTSAMIVPLSVRGAHRGAITFVSGESRRHFTASDLAFAQELASRAGSAIENSLNARDRVRLAENERDEQIRTRRRSERLYRLTSALASAMTTDSVTQRVCELAGQTVGAESTSLFLKDDADAALFLSAEHGLPSDFDRSRRWGLDQPQPLSRAIREFQPGYFESKDAFAAEIAPRDSRVDASPFHSWALLPLQGAAGSALGGLVFRFREPTKFGEEARQLMTAVAEQCSVALDRARAYEAEEAALRKKDEFLAMVGHELRNPLAPMLTATSLIRLRGVASERELGILERQGQHLVRMVDDLLDVSRITSGKLTLRTAPVEVAEVVSQAVESTNQLFESKAIHLHVNVPPSGLTVRGDRERLVQVVTNLLVNAAKFTPPERGVSVEALRREGSVVIEVRDEGEGIDAELLPRVFDLFAQGKQALDRRGGGLGLGLAIARSVVLAHQGTIEAESPDRTRERQ